MCRLKCINCFNIRASQGKVKYIVFQTKWLKALKLCWCHRKCFIRDVASDIAPPQSNVLGFYDTIIWDLGYLTVFDISHHISIVLKYLMNHVFPENLEQTSCCCQLKYIHGFNDDVISRIINPRNLEIFFLLCTFIVSAECSSCISLLFVAICQATNPHGFSVSVDKTIQYLFNAVSTNTSVQLGGVRRICLRIPCGIK